MSLAAPLASPFFTGAGVSDLVPRVWDCAINGRPYMVDWKHTYTGVGRFDRQSISLLKPQQDTNTNVSEASLNPEEFARRAAESWHHGAGQARLDRSDSDPFRFRVSKGIDVWTKNTLGCLNATASKLTSANTNLLMAVAGTRLYTLDGTAARFTTDLTSWTAVTGLPGAAGTGIATDGFTIYTTHSASGIYSTNTGTGAASSYNARAADGICGYVKGRLMVSNANVLVNITGAATEKIVLTHPNTAFRWTAVAEGPGFIYASGFAGDKSLIYKTAVTADGTDLAVATVAGEMPDGEIIRSLQGYLGYLLAGTDKGLRLMSLDASGNVSSSGRVIPTTSAVYALEPQDRYVWFGLTNYDTTSTGLGRADLGEFTDPLTPAYASDLMATAQGTVQSVVTFGAIRVFSVSGAGVIAENTAAKVAGTIDSGLVGYGLPDTKVAMYLDTRFGSLPASAIVAVSLSADGAAFTTVGTETTAGTLSLGASAGQYRAETFEVRLVLTPSGTSAPAVSRWTLEANPAPGRGEFFDVPLLLFERVDTAVQSNQPVDVAGEISALLSMEALGEPVSYQDPLGTETVFVDDHTFLVDSMTERRDALNGTYTVRLRRPRQRS